MAALWLAFFFSPVWALVGSHLRLCSTDGLRTEEMYAGFRLKIEKMLTARVIVSHAVEMGGHHPKEEGGAMSMVRGPPPSSDPSSYEYGMRYVMAQGHSVSGHLRSDGFMMVGADLRIAPWFDLHLAGQFVKDNAASFVIADLRDKYRTLTLKMVQQTNFEANYSHMLNRRVTVGAQLQYDSASYWTNQSVMARIVTRFAAGTSVPREVVSLEAGTLSSRDQALGVPKTNEQWGMLESYTKQLGFLAATWWTAVGDNYRLTAAARLQRENKWKTTTRFGMEYVTQLAMYKGVVDPFNYEIAAEVREEVQPGVVWQMCAKVNYWEQTYRFGAGLTFQF